MLVLRKPDEIDQGDDIKRQHHGKRDMHLRRYVHVRILSRFFWNSLSALPVRSAGPPRSLDCTRSFVSPAQPLRDCTHLNRAFSLRHVGFRMLCAQWIEGAFGLDWIRFMER